MKQACIMYVRMIKRTTLIKVLNYLYIIHISTRKRRQLNAGNCRQM